MKALLHTDPGELTELMGGRGRAKRVWQLLREGSDPFDEALLGAKAHARLAQSCQPTSITLVHCQKSVCGTCKYLLELDDAERIECVLIPSPQRSTLCVSVQVGCAQSCVFCQTATMGLRRQLSAAEILAQVHFGLAQTRQQQLPPLRNIVIMGMGEPLDNFEHVQLACTLLAHHDAMAFAPRHVTLSTVGPSPQKIARAASLPVNLAWSVHAANADVRQQLVPSARYTPQNLFAAFEQVLASTSRHLFVEVALVANVNDSLACADDLAALLRALASQCRVNVIPVNIGRDGILASSAQRAEQFQQRLRDRGLFCMLRRPRGSDTAAACGQLIAQRND